MNRRFLAVGALMSTLMMGCSESGPRNAGVYLLLDTSGTYNQELEKAAQIINYTLSRLGALDSFAVARIRLCTGDSSRSTSSTKFLI